MEEMFSKEEEDLGEDSRRGHVGVCCLFADCGASPMGGGELGSWADIPST